MKPVQFNKTAIAIIAALLVMTVSGGAIIPPLYGRFVDKGKEALIDSGLEASDALAMAARVCYYILIPCYAIIFIFVVCGNRLKK
jgi:fucose permease